MGMTLSSSNGVATVLVAESGHPFKVAMVEVLLEIENVTPVIYE